MIAFSIFGRNIYRYGIFYVIGFILTYIFLYFLGEKQIFHKFPHLENIIQNDIDSLFIFLILGVLIGGRLGHVFIYDFSHYVNNWIEVFQIWKGGMSFIGGITGVIIGIIIFSKIKKLSFKEFIILLDLLACTAPICIALGRLGNFLNQELYGIIFSNPFGRSKSTISDLTSLGFLHVYKNIGSELRINTNLLSIIFEGLLLFITLGTICIKNLHTKKRRSGQISMIFLLRYSIIRFLLEYLRQDSQFEFIGRFSKSQRVFLGGILIGIIGLIYVFRHKKENL